LAWSDKEATNRQEVTMRAIARCFLLFGLVAVVPGVAAAQATLAGEVKDTTGAVLPGVTVEAASPALTGKVRTAVTDGSGRYRLESLPPGSYTVTFSLSGFAPEKREGLSVSGSGVITVDVVLTVGVAETITVTARRREESSLDVPGAINAFSAAEIKTQAVSPALTLSMGHFSRIGSARYLATHLERSATVRLHTVGISLLCSFAGAM
jgi:outer membrane receptor protein involved in Fe transport